MILFCAVANGMRDGHTLNRRPPSQTNRSRAPYSGQSDEREEFIPYKRIISSQDTGGRGMTSVGTPRQVARAGHLAGFRGKYD